ncbi:MAG: Secretion system C-terminal sorting domain, partial [Bacteroidota bacterium]
SEANRAFELVGTLPNNNGAVYNFGKYRNLLNSLSVVNGGSLVINQTGATGYLNQDNTVSSTFVVKTSNCGANIFIENGGQLRLGDNSREGVLHVTAGSSITIRAGGSVQLNNASKIIVENGGKLILEAGSNIANNGIITIQAGGELVINGQPNLSGTGYIRFEKDNVLTMNTDWRVNGTHPSQRMIQIAREASIIIPDARTLTLENGLVEREAGYVGNTPNHIIVRKTGGIRASYVTFDDYSTGPSRFIYLDGPEQNEFVFNNCTFLNSAIAVELKEPANRTAPREYGWGPANQRVNVRFLTCTFLNANVIRAERAFIVELNHCTVNGGGLDVSYAYWVDIHNITTMRGNYTGTAVKVKNVVHTELYDNSLIDKYETGIQATESWNHNITMYDHASIQTCATGIHLNGGVNNAYGLDWGMIYMDCARMLDNLTAIRGDDILFNMYARGGRTNLFTRNSFLPTDSRFFESTFKCRNPSDLWLQGSYWSGFVPSNATVNPYWSFRQTTCTGSAATPWTGNLHINEPNWWNGAVITDPNHGSIQNCGGLTLRSPENNQQTDLMAQNTIVFADGQYRNVKIQQDAALNRLRNQELNAAENLLVPIARLSQTVRDTANAVVKHMVDVARVMVVGGNGIPGGLARNDFGWLPEATVYMDKTAADISNVKLYPNPANDFFRLELKQGATYKVNIFDAVGKRVQSLDASGEVDLDTKNWQSGVYMIHILNQANQQRTYGKVVIQH